jgi:hypothetical protein
MKKALIKLFLSILIINDGFVYSKSVVKPDFTISCDNRKVYFHRGRDLFGHIVLIGKKRVLKIRLNLDNDSLKLLSDSVIENRAKLFFYDDTGCFVTKGSYSRWQNSQFLNFKKLPEKAKNYDRVKIKRSKRDFKIVSFPLLVKDNDKYSGAISGFKFKKRGYFKFKVIIKLESGYIIESNELVVYIH